MIMAWGASTILLGMGTPLPDVAALGAGLLSTRWLSADLDLSNSHPSRRWKFMGFIWVPYRKGVARRHRSGASHSVLLSTVIRVFYLLFFGVLLWSVATVIAFISLRQSPLLQLAGGNAGVAAVLDLAGRPDCW